MATLAPTGAYSGVMESQSVGEPLTRKIRTFLSEAPIWTRLMSSASTTSLLQMSKARRFHPTRQLSPRGAQKTRSCREACSASGPQYATPTAS